jgi:signal transduction histidine kinase
MAKRAKESEPSEPEREVGTVKVDEPIIDTPPAVDAKPELPPPPPRTASGPSFGDRIGRFFRFLWRLFLRLLFLGLLSLVLYLAVPWLYQTFIRPIQQNTAEVRELQSRQEQTGQELDDLRTRLETMESAQNQNAKSLSEFDQRLVDIETEIAARTESLETLEQMLTDLEGQNEAISVELERQINLLKSMELLSRARLSMYQSNFGLAKQDVQIARDLLATVQPDSPEKLAAELGAVILRLDLTLSNLPDFPVAASDDLDIAWQILLSGLPHPTPTLVESPTPVGIISATPTAVATSAPTLVVTVSPTATP